MDTPRICAVITNTDLDSIEKVEPLVDLFEVRIDIIGKSWRDVARVLKKPWIATNRLKAEGGLWEGSEEARRDELLRALNLGASIVDIELAAPDLDEMVPVIKKKAKCLISHHDTRRTPPPAELRRIIEDELAAGADICKLVTTARSFDDNANVIGMMSEFRPAEIVAFAMGQRGQMSRILCPLCGGAFTYAAINEGAQSASGQLTVSQLRSIYEMIHL
ncbi:MAG: type I 3-dehydroquinate dehydratase [Dehalococcoidia bacterium]|nr:MAG: type I 3-dehydroquinate dehydratase [Dehalococcoidia bacterium]